MEMRHSSTTTLEAAEALKAQFGKGFAARKLSLLRRLDRATLRTADEVRRYHEWLCYLRAYPDSRSLLASVVRALERFAERRDLKRHAGALKDSGIAGTEIQYPFYFGTAAWLSRRVPRQIGVVWADFDREKRLDGLLGLLGVYAETPGLDECAWPLKEWAARLAGATTSDAAWLAQRFDALPADAWVKEALYDDLDLPIVIRPGLGTPSRTRAFWPGMTTDFRETPFPKERPDLRRAALEPPREVRSLSAKDGRGLIDLAREAMVTRSRDLDVFVHGSEDDVRLIRWEDGLSFAAIGFVPERRLMLEAVYGFLTLMNGVPIGYVLNSALYGSAEIAFNVFESWRGAEAARVYSRVLGTVHHLFGADTFTIYPYQLGHENEEGLNSGAWWFYRKLGFAPRHRPTEQLARREEARMGKDPSHRSSRATLKKLAAHNVDLSLGPRRHDVIGELPLANLGLLVTDRLARDYGADREAGVAASVQELREILPLAEARGWRPAERRALETWAPLIASIPGLRRWKTEDQRALVAVIRAKGGRRESDFVRAFDEHPRLREALASLAWEGD
jgi:hypothetical protein